MTDGPGHASPAASEETPTFGHGAQVVVAGDIEAKPGQAKPWPQGHAPMGASLLPVLEAECEGRLANVHWFRADWQRGGAATAYATFRDANDIDQPVVIKLPVPPGEMQWLVRLQETEDVAPQLYGYGATLGGYDIAWVVMERLEHGPLSGEWQGEEFDLLIQAVGRFYAAAHDVKPTGKVRTKDWEAILKRARENVRRHSLAEEQRWASALKKAHKKLPKWVDVWEQRPVDEWIHGDLHLANAMTRSQPPQGPAILFDFAETRLDCWVDDAVYLEHLYWARRDRLGGRKICSLIAKERKKHGLHVDADWPQLASVRRALLAMSTPAMLHADGDPHHVHAALEVLEREVA